MNRYQPQPIADAAAAARAEWIKIRTLPGSLWLLGALVVTTVAVGAAAAAAVRCPSGGCGLDPARTSLTGIYLSQVVASMVAVIAVSGEYSSGMIRTTFTAMPRRATVLAAKAAIITAITLPAGAVAVLGSLLTGRILLSSDGIGPAHGYPAITLASGPVLRAAIGSDLYLVLIALLSLGIATIVREPAPAIGAVLGLLYLAPILAAAIGSPAWHHNLERYAPMTAGLTVQATTGLRNLPVSPWAGLGILAAWAFAALLTGGLLLRMRDS
jgi:ABC-2 type transport system permease protein